MGESTWKKMLVSGMVLSAAVLTSCSGGSGGGGSYSGGGSSGGSGGGSTSTWGLYSNPTETANQFVDGLNNADGFTYNGSEVILYEDETYRSMEPGQDDWFVIYDAKYDENKAVSLQYIRSIAYYDYYMNSTGLAEEFRNIEDDDWFAGEVNGDTWGDDYEVVDYDPYTDSFWGRNSGMEYEDESESKDGSLLAAEEEEKQFLKKASNVSFAFNVSIETAMSLVTLGDKVEKMLGQGEGELTSEDQAAIMGDIEHLTGASLSDVMEAGQDSKKKQELVESIADKIGTSAENLENRVLPELFGIQI